MPGVRKVLILAHREELLLQAQRQIQRFAPHLKVSLEKGRNYGNSEESDVIIASVSTLGRRGDLGGPNPRLQRFNPDEFKAIIIDEAHHSVAESYLRIVRYFGIPRKYSSFLLPKRTETNEEVIQDTTADPSNTLIERKHILVWGCSATLSRNDELALGHLFEKVVYQRDLALMMEEGWLCPVEICKVFTDVSLKDVKIKDGDLDQRDLSLAIDTPARNELVAATWHRIARDENQRKATIVFGLNVKHIINLAQSFSSLGVETAIITGETGEIERAEIINRFAKGEIPVLLNCAVLTEGTDIPLADCILMTRPTCNPNLYIQMVGRGLRKHPTKDYCLIIDFLDKWRPASRNLITLPSLMAAKDPKKILKTSSGQINCHELQPISRSSLTDINPSLITLNIQQERLLKINLPKSPLAWFEVHDNVFVLAGCILTFLLQVELNREVDNETLARILTFRNETNEKGRQHYILTSTGLWQPLSTLLEDLLKVLQKDQEEYCGQPCDPYHFYQSNSFWRKSRPMSPGQKKYLHRILDVIPNVQEWERSQIYSWSKGRVADLVVKYLFRTRLLKIPLSSFEEFITGVPYY